MARHEFEDSGEAYDASQTEVPIGDVLVIETEGVIGISTTWPIAVTLEHGHLHAVREDADLSRMLTNSRLTADHVRDAVAAAEDYGLAVAKWARCVLLEHDLQHQGQSPSA